MNTLSKDFVSNLRIKSVTHCKVLFTIGEVIETLKTTIEESKERYSIDDYIDVMAIVLNSLGVKVTANDVGKYLGV